MTIEPMVAVVLVNLATALFRKFVVPKWGTTGVQVVVAGMALVAAVYFQYGQAFGLELWVSQAITLAVAAIALYEVLWKKIDLSKLLPKNK